MTTRQTQERQTHHEELPSTAAIAGHPIHPMLIPFPIAFLVGALLTDIAYWQTTDPFWARVSLWLIGAGAVSGLLAGLFGAIDFFTIEHVREIIDGKIHAVGNITAVVLALVNLALRWGDPEGGILWLGLIISLLVAAILAVTGWYGGELSYRHKVGVVDRGS